MTKMVGVTGGGVNFWASQNLSGRVHFEGYSPEWRVLSKLSVQPCGMVDHMNYKIHDMLAKHVAEHQRDWDVHLPMVMMAYQSSVHSFTQYTTHDLNWTRSAITLGCYAWL